MGVAIRLREPRIPARLPRAIRRANSLCFRTLSRWIAMAARCFSIADWKVSGGLAGAVAAARSLGHERRADEQNPEKTLHMDLSAKTRVRL